MSTSILDLEHLQQLTYERSKTWATFLEKVAQKETLEEIYISQLGEGFGPECDQNDTDDELASMEDDECDKEVVDSEVLRNVTNTARMSLLLNNKSLVCPRVLADDESNKFVDLFNQTLPIISEHNRQLKESGFDRILSSFDKKKIEEKVGSWLNRHNTLYGGDATLRDTESKELDYDEDRSLLPSSSKMCRKRRNNTDSSPFSKVDSNDSDDSLQSGETARYIRSSRAGTIKNSSSTTTMIKTYRLVKSTRDALRKKYACGKDDDDFHLKVLRQRRKIATELDYHHNYYDLARLQRNYKHEMHMIPSSRRQKRKVLRKRSVSNSCSTLSTSSDSDYFDKEDRIRRTNILTCCSQYHCSAGHKNYPCITAPPTSTVKRSQRSTIKMSSTRLNRMYCYSLSKSLSSSSSSGSFAATNRKRRMIKRNYKFCCDNRPCKRESECRCCNDIKLCQEYNHVVDTSTREWYVDNCYTPQKPLKTPSHPKAHKPVTSNVLETLPSVCDDVKELPKNKMNLRTKNVEYSPNKTEDEAEKFEKTELKTESSESSKNNSSILDETFNRELELAIKASKDLYEKEQKLKESTESVKKKENHKILPTKPVRKLRTKSYEEKQQVEDRKKSLKRQKSLKNDPGAINVEDELLEKIPKIVGNKSDAMTSFDQDFQDNSNTEFIKPKPSTVKKTVKKVKKSTMTTTENTFFASSHNQVICNSTAMSSTSQAYSRQFTDSISQKNEGVVEGMAYEAEDIEAKEMKVTTPIEAKMKQLEAQKTSKPSKKKSNNTVGKKSTASSTVTSTTIPSPDTNSTASVIKSLIKNGLIDDSEDDELSDCTLVTSTTNIEPSQHIEDVQPIMSTTQQLEQNDETLNVNHQHSEKGILIYSPHNRFKAPANSFTNDGYFIITKEHLSRVIGEKSAEKFLKHYIGRRRFNSNSRVYFRPPVRGSIINNVSSSSDSDDDLDSLGQYGDLYESLN